jgi:hypothetical protein
VRKVGLEPTRPFERWNLNPVRLPISPLPRSSNSLVKDFGLGTGYLAVAWDLCRLALERKLELLTYKGFLHGAIIGLPASCRWRQFDY